MTLTLAELLQESGKTGFPVEPLEKVAHLLELLQTLNSHPFLKSRLALKGGTALNLFPMLRHEIAPARGRLQSWCETMVQDCRKLLYSVLPLTSKETEFLTKLNDHGEIAPELLSGDQQTQTLIRNHPGLLWKAQNARTHKTR